jgi:Flp pilus assembly protein TadB
MPPLFAAGVIFALIAAYVTWGRRSQRPDINETLASFDTVAAATSGPLASGLAKLARPVVGTKAVGELAQSPMMRAMRERVTTTGLYGGDLNVFLSYQIASVFTGCVFAAAALVSGQGTIIRAAVALIGVGIAGWPINQVNQTAKKSSEEAAKHLPDFVELLQMPLATGMTITAAMAFTANQSPDGVVTREVRWLLDTLSARTMSEEDAYREAGRRIGSPEAIAFFNALGQAAISGVKVSEALARQAESLRLKAHQVRRAKIKKIPVTLVVAFAMHFLPLLFAVTMLPMVYSLMNI